ncbi:IS110 family transposase (plasmid) [Mesorhizobium sp. AR02]|uniref:IS110 family transposase n=1 Tax=Mesorhizobium sp. AR02 TaxID=2865837 RepID=UPI00215FD0C2|nr:IS110 family transposase [Mesorhizobium sp. AR02]UVK50324.1 IS110 family transposase [Mesorhizobium sp. AR02]
MRIIALDVHGSFAQMAILEKGKIRDAGRIDLERSRLLQFAMKLKPDDEIVIEATGNTSAIVRLLSPFVGRVVIANPILVRAIAWAKVKTDKIDAAVLAKLHASGFLPEVWMPDEETETRRRVVAERTQFVSQMTRLKNRIHSVLHANLIPPYKGTLFSKRGRAWLEAQPLAEDQRRVVLRHAGELDRLGELAQVDKSLAQTALQEPRVKRLMTITGVNVTVALSIVAAIGDVERFSSPEKLVSYFGLNPRVRQSGDKPAYHGRITKQGRAHARSMLVEAAWVISGVPGPLRAFFMRIRDKRGKHVAAVATARKLAVIVWHMLTKDENYIRSRSALLDWKLRKLELTAGYPSLRGGKTKGSAADYSNKSVRESERETIGNAEEVYRRFVATWKQQSPKGRSGAAHEVRRS